MRIAQITLGMAVLALFSGCSEDPGDRAVSQLQTATSKTLTQFARDRDHQAAQKQLESLSPGRASGLSVDSAILASADLQLATPQQEQIALMLQTPALNRSADTINQVLQQLSSQTIRLTGINNLLALSEVEVTEIEKWIGSESEPASLKGQIAQAQLKTKELSNKQTVLSSEFQQACDAMLKIESAAEENLRQAQTAEGNIKVELENTGFDLKNQKMEYYIKAQEAENVLAEVEAELGIIQPHLQRLEDNLQRSQEKLAAIKTSSARMSLLAQQKEITAQINQLKEELRQKINGFTTQLAEYQQQCDDVIKRVNEAIEKYQAIRSRQLDPTVNMSLGQAYTLAGSVLASRIYTTSDLANRLEGFFRAFQTTIPDGFSSPISPRPEPELTAKVMEYFDLAFESYGKAESSSGQLGENSQKAACAALKGQLLAMHNKIRLANRISDFDTLEKAQTQLDQLTEKSKEYGVLFSQSATAMLLSKGLNYIPVLPVDSAIVLEGIKKDFASWRTLRGPEAETEVERLLKHIDDLLKKYPGNVEISEFLTQERQAIEDAKVKGFAPEPEPEQAPADANSMNPNI